MRSLQACNVLLYSIKEWMQRRKDDEQCCYFFISQYYITLCIIFFGQVGGAVYVFLKSNEFKDLFVKTLKEELVPLYTEKTDKKTLVDWIQEQVTCVYVVMESCFFSYTFLQIHF